MKQQLVGMLAGVAFIAVAGSAMGHHSFAMFDQENPLEFVGSVQEFRFTNPHTFILLAVKEKDGSTTVWNLEGASPSGLVRDGWSSKTIKPGDEVQMTVWPLRSGAPGGAWNVRQIKFKGGEPVVKNHP